MPIHPIQHTDPASTTERDANPGVKRSTASQATVQTAAHAVHHSAVAGPHAAAYSGFHALRHPPRRPAEPEPIMQSRFLNARIESTLTLAIGALSVMVIAVGTLGLARSFDPTPDSAVAVVPPLERVVITSQHARAQAAQAATTLTASTN